jgi:hypothetical protein
MKLHEIYGDFHNLDDENRIRLTTLGSLSDIARLGIQLRDGLALTITADDADDDGNSDDLMADGVIRYNEKEKCWVAQIDWSKVQNRSEREKTPRPKNPLADKNGATPTPRKANGASSRKPGGQT